MGYAREYAADSRKIYQIGCNFSSKTGTIDGWKMKWWFARISWRCSDAALLRMNLLYISLPEILVFSDVYYFFENIVNMKKIGKVLVIRRLWFSDKMAALRKIYSCTTIGLILNREQKTEDSGLSILLFLSLDSKNVGIWILSINFDGRYLYSYDLN